MESNSKKRLPICVRGRKSHLPQEAGCAKFTPLNRAANKIQRSSVVERSAVNRLVVGSNPTAGAIFLLMTYKGYILQNESGRFYVDQTDHLVQRRASHKRTDKTAAKITRKNEP